jgi:hypothetical protein
MNTRTSAVALLQSGLVAGFIATLVLSVMSMRLSAAVDVLLIKGREQISNAIRHLARPPWLPAAKSMGLAFEMAPYRADRHRLV